MRLRWVWLWVALGMGLAGCSGGRGGVPTQTAVAIVQGTSPLDTVEPLSPAATATETVVAEATATTATTATAAAPAAGTMGATEATASPAGPEGMATAAAGVFGDPLLRTYRVMVSMQVAGELLAETAARVQAGELDEEDTGVAALALGALVQSVDEDVPEVTPPAELADAWQRALAAHEAIKARAGEWLLRTDEAGSLGTALAPSLADLEAALAEADAVVAAAYGMEGPRLTEYREQIARALRRLYDE